ncbi:hypothetical protein U9M48_002638 [Paspalum notatum var. saurae]|uniref:Uncharacterized protein n=1 Tax=Paspalum notatum var. saurae TaxID=547442 RepID=A0AAQ3PHF6_PASNO
MDGNDLEHRFDWSVVVYGKLDRAYHGCYDLLGYPLFSLVERPDGRIKTFYIGSCLSSTQSGLKQ